MRPKTPEPLWLRMKLFIQSKAEGSQRKYWFVLRRWCEFIGAEEGTRRGTRRFARASEEQAAKFAAALRNTPGHRRRGDRRRSPLANSTLGQNLRILKRLYRSLHEAGLCDKNPFSTPLIPQPNPGRGSKRRTEIVPFDMVEELLDAPDLTHHRGLRDKAILLLLFGCGLRRMEVANLDLEDLRVTAGGDLYLELRATKSGEDQQMAIPEWATPILSEWVSFRHRSGAGPQDPLFTGYRGRGGMTGTPDRVTGSGLYAMFVGYCQDLGLVHKTPHSARVTAINKLLDAGFDYFAVKEFSRHKSIDMVQAYDRREPSLKRSLAQHLNYFKKRVA